MPRPPARIQVQADPFEVAASTILPTGLILDFVLTFGSSPKRDWEARNLDP